MKIFEDFFTLFAYAFIQRAVIAGALIGLTCALLGIFLVLRRFSLIGDGLAHVSLATVALGLFLGTAPLLISIPLVMLASIGILKLADKTKMYGDSAIGLVSSVGVALGIIISSAASGFNVDLFSYLFGSILAISTLEVWLSVLLCLTVIFCVVFFYHDLFSMTFDEDFASVSGINSSLINKLLILLTAVIVVLGIRVVGTLLISSLIVFPSVTALQVSRSFKIAIVIAAGTAVISVILGIISSFFLDLPTGAVIVMLNFLFFCLAFIISKVTGRE